MTAPRGTIAAPWRPVRCTCVRGLLAVLAALECETAGLPEWMALTRFDDDAAVAAGALVEARTDTSPRNAAR